MKHTFVVLAYGENEYLEDCLKSVTNQSVKTKVLIATTTPNRYIETLARKYGLEIKKGKHTTIGGDFDFARNCADTELVTIAHQDDVYEETYAEKIINNYEKYKDALIVFSDYYEIRERQKTYTNSNLIIKRFLLANLRIKQFSGIRFLKRNSIRYGNAISCPAVTYVQRNCPKKVFNTHMRCDIDWDAWEKLSRLNGKFVFVNMKLMGHRISNSTTTTDIINRGVRTKEDLEVLRKFWPDCIAKLINKLYRKSEKNNSI